MQLYIYICIYTIVYIIVLYQCYISKWTFVPNLKKLPLEISHSQEREGLTDGLLSLSPRHKNKMAKPILPNDT